MASGSVEVSITSDGLTTTIGSIGPSTTLEQVMEALKEMGVVHGIRSSGVVGAIDTAKTEGKPVIDLVVAEGKAPRPKVPPQVQQCPGGEEGSLPQLRVVSTLVSVEEPKAIREGAKGVVALAVKKGDVLARKVVGEIEPGKTVLGKDLTEASDEQLGPQFLPGPGVSLGGDSTEYQARHAGYAGLLDGKVSVVPPIWISGDAMKAAYLNLPLEEASNAFSKEDLEGMLSAAGVKEGVDQKKVGVLAAALSSGKADKLLYLIAVGTVPVEPQDAAPEFSIAHGAQAGVHREDGSIDLRERQRYPSVAENEVVVSCTPPVPGTPGITVKGEAIDVRPPVSVELAAGDNVRLETSM